MQSEQQLHAALQNTADAILAFDAQARLSLLNPAGQKLFADFEAKPGQRLATGSGYDSFLQLLDQTRHSSTSFSGEVEWPDKRVFSASIVPDQEGGCVVVLQDVSRFKEIEKIKNEIIATASHDLRTPLTSIIGFSHLIKQAGPLTELQSDFVQRIEHATANMSELVENMMNQAKLKLGDESRKAEVDLMHMLWDVTNEFQPRAEVKRLLLTIEKIELNTKVFGDALQLRQALRNLVGNAIKYTPDGGAITLSLEHESNMAKIQIKDTRYGISSSDVPHIIDRSYRIRNNEHDPIESNGLELAISKSIIEQHQGQIDVQSQSGKGTCFTLNLPLARVEDVDQ